MANGSIRNTPSVNGRRAGLARWLTYADHPLTARIIANRLWQHHFGQGIVATSNDFGTMGDMPSNAQLLDWLATEFMLQGWSMKKIQRIIVNSATYRQSSAATPDLLARDPYNKLYARGPRFRLRPWPIPAASVTKWFRP